MVLHRSVILGGAREDQNSRPSTQRPFLFVDRREQMHVVSTRDRVGADQRSPAVRLPWTRKGLGRERTGGMKPEEQQFVLKLNDLQPHVV